MNYIEFKSVIEKISKLEGQDMSKKIERLTKEERKLYEYLKEKRDYYYEKSWEEGATVQDDINYIKSVILYDTFCLEKKMYTFKRDEIFLHDEINRKKLVLSVYLLFDGEREKEMSDYSKNGLIDDVLDVYRMMNSEKFKNELYKI